jgi:tetratricopeptide (TPR) repeat protein
MDNPLTQFATYSNTLEVPPPVGIRLAPMSRASLLAETDLANEARRPFALGSRPVIRWIKGDGLDDDVTRSAIAQATRLFGGSVDYCLCTAGISPARARSVLAWAEHPVEWWPLTPQDNPPLAAALMAAGCYSDRFGYWWKWFPERVRIGAPEWILDGDMVITGTPSWFKAWYEGKDYIRVTQDDAWDINGLYGEYLTLVDQDKRLYSGLISLPPDLTYTPAMLEVLRVQPLTCGHDGRTNMSEQGVVACAFDALCATPIPLSEFPFGRAFEEQLNYGLTGPNKNSWGFHFGYAFRCENPHFRRLAAEGQIFWMENEPPPEERFLWLVNRGQWGTPGWSMHPTCVKRIVTLAQKYAGHRVLELGTSRGFLAAIMAAYGCIVTTVDKTDRGASTNLKDMGVDVVVSDAVEFLHRNESRFSLIVVDIHDNSVNVWDSLWPLVSGCLSADGVLVLYNTHLWKMSEWSEETGLRWITESSPPGWSTEVFSEPTPGMVLCRPLKIEEARATASSRNQPATDKTHIEGVPSTPEDLNSSLTVERDKLAAGKAGVESALRAAERAILNLTLERDRLVAEKTDLEGKWAAARSQILALTADQERLLADKAQLDGAIAATTARHDTLITDNARLDRAFEAAQGEISDLVRERDQLAAAKASIETLLAKTQAEGAEETGRLASQLNTRTANIKAVIAACSDQTLWLPSTRSRHLWLRRLPYASVPLLRLKKRRRAKGLIEKANRARDASEWVQAAHNYREGLGLMPDNAAIWVQYGHALKESGYVGQAEAAYRRSLEIDASIADTHLQLAHALKLQGRRFEAVAACFRAIMLDPTLSSVLQELIVLLET